MSSVKDKLCDLTEKEGLETKERQVIFGRKRKHLFSHSSQRVPIKYCWLENWFISSCVCIMCVSVCDICVTCVYAYEVDNVCGCECDFCVRCVCSYIGRVSYTYLWACVDVRWFRNTVVQSIIPHLALPVCCGSKLRSSLSVTELFYEFCKVP